MLRYPLTVFLGAYLLFQVQLTIAKSILPRFGGGPVVWTTCMLFFQISLLVGYTYSHLLTTRLGLRHQAIVHVVLLAGSLAFLSMSPPDSWQFDPTGWPVAQILLLLFFTVGFPVFVLSTNSPLMQRWFSQSFPGCSPYRLFALSNVASMLALLSYPFFIEPTFPLGTQATIWSSVYAVFVALAVWCCVRIWFGTCAGAPPPSTPSNDPSSAHPTRPSVGQMSLWLALAATASALMLATTNQLCIDIAAMPVLWVLLLSIYLVTFIICFQQPRWYVRPVYGVVLLLSAPVVCWIMADSESAGTLGMIAAYSSALFAGCMICHGELVCSRPHSRHLTLFHLLVATGGAMGGVFVGLVAPASFGGFWEYPIALIGTSLLALHVWKANVVWMARPLLPFWIWIVVTAVHFLLLLCVLYRPVQAMSSRDTFVFFAVSGLICFSGWLVTAGRAAQAAFLIRLWGLVFLVQFLWVLLWVCGRYPGLVVSGQLIWIALATVGATAAGGVLTKVGGRLHSKQERSTLVVCVMLGLPVGITAQVVWQAVSAFSAFVLLGLWMVVNMVDFVRTGNSWATYVRRGLWFSSTVFAAVAALGVQLTLLMSDNASRSVCVTRNSHGLLRVKTGQDEYNGKYISLTHGQTEHGFQFAAPQLQHWPTAYYGEGTGVEMAIRLDRRLRRLYSRGSGMRVGVIGLGAGTLAVYAERGDYYRFYEIDPAVVGLANEYFTFLKNSRGRFDIVVGDARITLKRELAEGTRQHFDLLVVDAFSSDAVPVHLLTRECAEVYREHLQPDGLLVLHLSNRFLDLTPVGRGLAEHIGWTALRIDTEDNERLGIYGATWLILTKNERFLSLNEVQNTHLDWNANDARPVLWTDDFSTLWPLIWQ